MAPVKEVDKQQHGAWVQLVAYLTIMMVPAWLIVSALSPIPGFVLLLTLVFLLLFISLSLRLFFSLSLSLSHSLSLSPPFPNSAPSEARCRTYFRFRSTLSGCGQASQPS